MGPAVAGPVGLGVAEGEDGAEVVLGGPGVRVGSLPPLLVQAAIAEVTPPRMSTVSSRTLH